MISSRYYFYIFMCLLEIYVAGLGLHVTLIFALARHCALADGFHACVAPGLTGPASRAFSFAELEQGFVFKFTVDFIY